MEEKKPCWSCESGEGEVIHPLAHDEKICIACYIEVFTALVVERHQAPRYIPSTDPHTQEIQDQRSHAAGRL